MGDEFELTEKAEVRLDHFLKQENMRLKSALSDTERQLSALRRERDLANVIVTNCPKCLNKSPHYTDAKILFCQECLSRNVLFLDEKIKRIMRAIQGIVAGLKEEHDVDKYAVNSLKKILAGDY